MEKVIRKVRMLFFVMAVCALSFGSAAVQAEETGTQSGYTNMDESDNTQKHLAVGEVFTKTVQKEKYEVRLMGEGGYYGVDFTPNKFECRYRVTKSATDDKDGEVEFIGFSVDPANVKKQLQNTKNKDYIFYEFLKDIQKNGDYSLTDSEVDYGEETFRFTSVGSRVKCTGSFGSLTISGEAGESLERIRDEAFAGCKYKVNITSENLKEIGNMAFAGPIGGVRIDAGNLEEIGNRAFAGVKGYIDISANNLKKIGSETFVGVTEIEIYADNLEEIRSRAFVGAAKEIEITAKKLRKICDSAFVSAKDVSISAGVKFEEIGSNAFRNCKGFMELKLEGLRKIDSKIFKDCKALKGLKIVGKNIKTIGNGAFKGCKNLKELVIEGDGIEKVGKGTFVSKGRLSLTLGKIKTLNRSMMAGCKNATDIYIDVPKVKTIGNRAFSDCKKAKRISLHSNTPITIGHRIFAGCRKLNDVTLSSGNKLKTAKGDAFKGAPSKCKLYSDDKKAVALKLKGKGMEIWWMLPSAAGGTSGPAGRYVKI